LTKTIFESFASKGEGVVIPEYPTPKDKIQEAGTSLTISPSKKKNPSPKRSKKKLSP
jgi:hypothetical protein